MIFTYCQISDQHMEFQIFVNPNAFGYMYEISNTHGPFAFSYTLGSHHFKPDTLCINFVPNLAIQEAIRRLTHAWKKLIKHSVVTIQSTCSRLHNTIHELLFKLKSECFSLEALKLLLLEMHKYAFLRQKLLLILLNPTTESISEVFSTSVQMEYPAGKGRPGVRSGLAGRLQLACYCRVIRCQTPTIRSEIDCTKPLDAKLYRQNQSAHKLEEHTVMISLFVFFTNSTSNALKEFIKYFYVPDDCFWLKPMHRGVRLGATNMEKSSKIPLQDVSTM